MKRVHMQEQMDNLGSRSFDETMANAAYIQGLVLVAILQKVGPVELEDGWFERAETGVMLSDPVPGKQFGDGARVYAVPREESGVAPYVPKFPPPRA